MVLFIHILSVATNVSTKVSLSPHVANGATGLDTIGLKHCTGRNFVITSVICNFSFISTFSAEAKGQKKLLLNVGKIDNRLNKTYFKNILL